MDSEEPRAATQPLPHQPPLSAHEQFLRAVQDGNVEAVKRTLNASEGIDMNKKDEHGMTALHVAARNGHVDVVRELLRFGAQVDAKPQSDTAKRVDSPLLVAARAGHFDVVNVLIRAGASVHDRAADGATLLTYAALWHNTSVVSALFALGHLTLQSTDDEPAKLVRLTMQTLLEDAQNVYEFAPMWQHIVDQFQYVHALLAAATIDSVDRDINAQSFVLLLCHLVRLKPLCAASSMFARLAASQTVANRLRDVHTELVFLEHEVASSVADSDAVGPAKQFGERLQEWKPQFTDNERVLLTRFRESVDSIAETDATKRHELIQTERDSVPLIQHKLFAQGNTCNPELIELLERCLSIVRETYSSALETEIPTWFIPEHDLVFAASNEPSSAALVHGKWSNSDVLLSKHAAAPREAFVASVDLCVRMNHPNVTAMFGASHLRMPYVAVFEKPASTSLREYLAVDEHKHEIWQKLHEVALGVSYLVNHGVVLETLRCDDIWVGTDGLAKVHAFSCLAPCAEPQVDESDNMTVLGKKIAKAKLQRVRWKAPECILGETATAASVVYSLAMCLLEALTSKVPWSDTISDDDVALKAVSNIRPPEPDNVSEAQQHLLEQMWSPLTDYRPTLSDARRRFKQFADESEKQQQQQQQHPLEEVDFDTHVIPGTHWTIPAFFEILERRWTYCTEHREAIEHILARSHDVFALLQLRQSAQNDAVVVSFCDVLLGLDRFLRYAVTAQSVLESARSQRAALRNNVFHFQLDELLNQLAPTEIDPVHEWRHREYPTDVTSSVIRDTNALNTSAQRAQSTRAQAAGTPDVMTITRFKNDRLTDAFKELDFKAIDAAAEAVAAGQTDTATSPQLGTQLPWLVHQHEFQYRPYDKIGIGSFSEIYRATWNSTPVAIKFMGYEDDENELDRELFFHELRVWLPLHHPHVARLYGACHVGKRFFVCEYVGGGSLDSYLNKQRTAQHISDKAVAVTTWRLLHQVALGLQYLHERNVLYNDLKCDNVLIDNGGNAKIIDFGLSSILQSAEMRVEPKHQGAIQWRSPEYLRGDRLTLASDVYAFGMLLLEAVTGANPWGNSPDVAVKYYVKKRSRLPPQPKCLNKSEWTLVQLMCVSEPSRRVQIATVVDKLHEFAQQARELETNRIERDLATTENDEYASAEPQLPQPIKASVDDLLVTPPNLTNSTNDVPPPSDSVQPAPSSNDVSADASEDAYTRLLQSPDDREWLTAVSARKMTDLLTATLESGELHWTKLLLASGAPTLCSELRENAALASRLFEHAVVVLDQLLLVGPDSSKAVAAVADAAPLEAVDSVVSIASLRGVFTDAVARLLAFCCTYSQPRNIFVAVANGRHVLGELDTIRQQLDELRESETRDLARVLPDRSAEVESLTLLQAALNEMERDGVGSAVDSTFGSADHTVDSGVSSVVEASHVVVSAATAAATEWHQVLLAARDKVMRICGYEQPPDVPAWFVPPSALKWDPEHVDSEGSFTTLHCAKVRVHTASHAEYEVPVVVKRLKMHGLGGVRSNDSFFQDVERWYTCSQEFDSSANAADTSRNVAEGATGTVEDSVPDSTGDWRSQNYHRHILKLLGASHVNRQAYLVVERAEHGDLLTYLRQPANVAKIWERFHEAAVALQYLHERNIMHGHLTCANIVVTGDERAKLTDIGFNDVRSAVHAACANAPVASPSRPSAVQWMAPELCCSDNHALSPASDVHSLGMCMLEAITQRPPWDHVDGGSMDEDELIDKIEAGALPPFPVEDEYKDVYDIIRFMCDREPDDRMSLDDVIEALEEFSYRVREFGTLGGFAHARSSMRIRASRKTSLRPGRRSVHSFIRVVDGLEGFAAPFGMESSGVVMQRQRVSASNSLLLRRRAQSTRRVGATMNDVTAQHSKNNDSSSYERHRSASLLPRSRRLTRMSGLEEPKA